MQAAVERGWYRHGAHAASRAKAKAPRWDMHRFGSKLEGEISVEGFIKAIHTKGEAVNPNVSLQMV